MTRLDLQKKVEICLNTFILYVASTEPLNDERQRLHVWNPCRGNSMRTKRIRIKIAEYLKENGPQTTFAIQEHINDCFRHGTTSQQLGNCLSKDKRFKKVGFATRKGVLSGHYEVCVWDLVTEPEPLNG